MNILETLSDEVFRIEKDNINPISDEAIGDIISILKQFDKELNPVLDILYRLIQDSSDRNLKTLSIVKIMKFYGINNHDILSCRQKIVLEEKILSKKQFLKKSQRDNLEALLECLDIKVK
jgi:hypothetical protein